MKVVGCTNNATGMNRDQHSPFTHGDFGGWSAAHGNQEISWISLRVKLAAVISLAMVG